MATSLDKHAVIEETVLVVEAEELEEARRDERVRGFLAEADELLDELEREDANL